VRKTAARMEPTIAPTTAPMFDLSFTCGADEFWVDCSVGVGCDMAGVVDEGPEVGVMLATTAALSANPSYGYANA